jgi:hypothetical protein
MLGRLVRNKKHKQQTKNHKPPLIKEKITNNNHPAQLCWVIVASDTRHGSSGWRH